MALRVVGEALAEVPLEERILQAHGVEAEEAVVHQPRLPDGRPKGHLRENVALDVDARGDFDEFQSP